MSAAHAREVTDAFYKAVFLVADEHAGDPLAKASSFARTEMHAAVLQRIPRLLQTARCLGPEEIRSVLESRRGDQRQASYGKLTCLFVEARSWVKLGKNGTWTQAPLNEEQKESLWKKAGNGNRREALMALYASGHGKEVRTFRSSCRGCDGRPRSGDLRLGEIVSAASRDAASAARDTCCRSCRGVGVVVSVLYR